MPDGNGWNEYKRQVLHDLSLMERDVECVEKKVDKLESDVMGRLAQMQAAINTIITDLAVTKTRIALWAGGIGLIGSILVQLVVKFLAAKIFPS